MPTVQPLNEEVYGPPLLPNSRDPSSSLPCLQCKQPVD
eukprot:CAMPEP_0201497544 /NCGR_PEP_ID=MMETSP0151_2-20130828/66313_1 /ASSEMBLY_ACC=CAM_ASM_000257 /TAXON_ID=200890 /ORGANISM="Paramoeba atlantica, Strain 621/1 / CCAP 1560/9" /LENGTH=37 /DNA_ID= /DNA_START= /DNA_END= /DNA_ORIENTATION=